jgi:hypothetical protein
MGLFLGRREFVLGASSLGPLLVGDRLNLFDKVGARNDGPCSLPVPSSLNRTSTVVSRDLECSSSM